MNSDEAKRIFTKLDALAEGQAELRAKFEGLKGVVETSLKQHTTEIAVLFSHHNRHEGRIGQIERSYVSETDCKADMSKNCKEHEKFRDAIDEQRSFSGKVIGAALAAGIFVSGLIGLIAWAASKLGEEG